MQVEEIEHQPQQMELVPNPTSTENDTMATQARVLDQGIYV